MPLLCVEVPWVKSALCHGSLARLDTPRLRWVRALLARLDGTSPFGCWRRRWCALQLEKELGLKVNTLRQATNSQRFLSAEGCYSYEAVRANLRIKIANKQTVGLEVPSTQQVLFVAGSLWACGGDVTPTEALLREMAGRTGREPCRTTLPPLQRAVGEMAPLMWVPEGCGKWIPADFRLCVSESSRSMLPADSRTVAVYARDGSFSAQRLEDAGLELANGCRQTSFFHFQARAAAGGAQCAALY